MTKDPTGPGGDCAGPAQAGALIIMVLITGRELSALRLLQASFAAGMLALAFGSIAMALGAYLLNGLALLIDGLHPYRYLSPFDYYSSSEPLVNGSPGCT